MKCQMQLNGEFVGTNSGQRWGKAQWSVAAFWLMRTKWAQFFKTAANPCAGFSLSSRVLITRSICEQSDNCKTTLA